MPDFIIFRKIIFFFANNFLTKSDLTSTLCRLLQVYYTYTSQVIKKLLQRDDSRFFSHGVSWVMPTFKTASVKNASFVVSPLVVNMRTKKYYSLIFVRQN
jgi:flagellar biosynthesis regulator FlbT